MTLLFEAMDFIHVRKKTINKNQQEKCIPIETWLHVFKKNDFFFLI